MVSVLCVDVYPLVSIRAHCTLRCIQLTQLVSNVVPDISSMLLNVVLDMARESELDEWGLGSQSWKCRNQGSTVAECETPSLAATAALIESPTVSVSSLRMLLDSYMRAQVDRLALNGSEYRTRCR